MALSGSTSTTFYNNQFTLSVEWTATQNIANNTSTVTAKMYLKSNGSLYLGSGDAGAHIRIDGKWYDGGSDTALSAGQKKLIHTAVRTLTHNATTGQKSFSLLGEINLGSVDVISPGSGKVGSLFLGYATPSKTFTLNTIPRASTLDSFSIANHLKPNTSNTVNLSITRRNSSYTHDIQLRDGSTVLQTWTGQGTPSTLTISSSTVNTLLSRMSNVTSRTLTLRVQTKSGSSNIGSAVTRTATVSVHSDVKPTATGLKVSIYGSGRDNTIGKFVQGISRVTSSFTGTATGGATVSSRRIVIRKVSGGTNSQTISSGSGTTSGKVTLSGTYEAIATVTDSRGRSATQRITFTVHAYSPPKVSSFTAVRNSSTPTTVNIGRYGTWSVLGGDNPLTIVVKRGSTTIQNVTGTSGSVSGTLNDTGRSITSSYTYTVTFTDTFGNSASASTSVSTQRVVLDIHKNEGVGIGKIHERGAFDCGGDAYFSNGKIYINNTEFSYEEGTWTPLLEAVSTYTIRRGRYIKSGNWVHVFGEIQLKTKSHTNPVGLSITGLPFVASTKMDRYVGFCGGQDISLGTTNPALILVIDKSTNRALIRKQVNDLTYSEAGSILFNGAIPTTGILHFQLSYLV